MSKEKWEKKKIDPSKTGAVKALEKSISKLEKMLEQLEKVKRWQIIGKNLSIQAYPY